MPVRLPGVEQILEIAENYGLRPRERWPDPSTALCRKRAAHRPWVFLVH